MDFQGGVARGWAGRSHQHYKRKMGPHGCMSHGGGIHRVTRKVSRGGRQCRLAGLQ